MTIMWGLRVKNVTLPEWYFLVVVTTSASMYPSIKDPPEMLLLMVLNT